jgi:hypothetical protein
VNLGAHTITVRRAVSAEDAYGNAERNWATATSVTVTGCSMQPVTGQEQTVGQDTIVSRWQLFAPDGTDLLATDRVEFNGDAYEVDGEVQRWGFPPLSHITALLRRSHA